MRTGAFNPASLDYHTGRHFHGLSASRGKSASEDGVRTALEDTDLQKEIQNPGQRSGVGKVPGFFGINRY